MGLFTCLKDVEMEQSDFHGLTLQDVWNKTGYLFTDPEEVVVEA